MYERELKERHPEKRDLIYDVKDLFVFLDDMADISALV
jgi:Enhancer of rudimentary